MKRPILFALECIVTAVLSLAGTWLVARAGNKMNSKANADVRSSYALQALVDVERERLAVDRRIADALERRAR
jgi:hypothetical protein